MSFYELEVAIEGYNRRLRHAARHLIAPLGCWILSPWSKKQITPEMLMGEKPPRESFQVAMDRRKLAQAEEEERRIARAMEGPDLATLAVGDEGG